MKTRINKSEVMKRAWKIFRGKNPYSYSFSAALRRAWFVEKENARAEIERIERAAAVIPSPATCPCWMRAAITMGRIVTEDILEIKK